jgi:RNA polymerase sigma-70 factor (ECF subfamily)
VAIEQHSSLEHLIRLAQQGDKRAYGDLLRKITPILKTFVGKRLGKSADIDDVVQDILLSIHRAGHTFDTDRPFKMWMFAIARYRLNDHLRQLYRKGAMPDISLDDLTQEIPAEDVTKGDDRREYLNDALNGLPDKQRKIITMMKIEGHTAEDTARALGMTSSAVKVAAHRAYKTLALKIEREA